MIITRKKLSKDYPFTLPSGRLTCQLSGDVTSTGIPIPHILFEADGVLYALNGYARASGLYRDYEDIWRSVKGKKVPMTKVMELAMVVLKDKFPDIYERVKEPV